MRVMLDTSVAVAGLLSGHPFHEASVAWLSAAKAGSFEFIFSGHSLAELYAVLTRLPMQPRMTPDTAGKLIREGILSCARIEVLGGEDYVSVIGEMIKDRKTGGVVYDAIIAKVAQLSQVDILITLNVSDFRRVWPDGAARIVPPQSVAVPQRRVW